MRDFVAIDFETANRNGSSICSMGAVIVRDGRRCDDFYSLVRPAPNYYSRFTAAIHGLTRADTDAADHFPEVWQRFAPRIGGLPLVAHNARFDEWCLRSAFEYYGLEYPDYRFACTLIASRRLLRGLPNYQLQTVSEACGYSLKDHHHALADAEACARIAVRLSELDGGTIFAPRLSTK